MRKLYLMRAALLLIAAAVVSPLAFGRGLHRPRLRLRSSQSSRLQSLSTLPGQSATLLPNGNWLLLGGEESNGVSSEAFLVDAGSGVKSPIPTKLIHGRAWHSATVLPNGTVLIFGGIGSDGRVVKNSEAFIPATLQFAETETAGLLPRAHHTATLMLNGSVLIAGGISENGDLPSELDLWDSRARRAVTIPGGLLVRRRDHTASLLASGDVLIWGGTGVSGNSINFGEVFESSTQRSRLQAEQPQFASAQDFPSLSISVPENGAQDVSVDARIAVLFSKPVQMQSANSATMTLVGPAGPVEANVIAAEGGMLAFVNLGQSLSAGATFTLTLGGLSDSSGQTLLSTSISFTTAGDSGSAGVLGGGGSMGGGTMPFDPTMQKLPPLQAAKGVTALAGQTLQVDGKPLEHVKIEIDNDHTFTDATGRFLLENLATGHHVMNVFGATAVDPKRPYGFFQIAVDIMPGKTNVLPFTMFIPVLDLMHSTQFSSPTKGEVVATTPLIPGLEVHIPAGDVLRWVDGKPLTSISITPIDMMMMPMPPPPGVETPVFFTIQADGALEEATDGSVGPGIRIVYPNVSHLHPGFKVDFWTYDPKIPGGWTIYGKGTVTPDGKQIVPDPGAVIHRLTCAPFGQGPKPNTGPRDHDPHGQGGEPVNLSTGLFVYNKTDLAIKDIIPIDFGRTYRQLDNISHSFGIGMTNSYELYLWGDGGPDWVLILPDGGPIHFTCVSTACTGNPGTVWQNTTDPGPFYMAVATQSPNVYSVAGTNVNVYEIRLKNGTVYGFNKSSGYLLYVHDRVGNQLTLTWDNFSNNGKATQITSPNGRSIQLTYDTGKRITQIQDTIGRTVSYVYDSSGRLFTATDAAGGVTTYTYDTSNNMQTIKDARQIVYLTNQYDANNRVQKQTQGDNSTYQYSYTLDGNGNITQTNVTNPRGDVRVVNFNADTYWTSDTLDTTGSAPSATIGNRQSGTNLMSSSTDALGRQTTMTYDPMGNVTSITRIAGTSNATTTSFTYEPTFNQLTSVTDALGNTTSFGYDTSGNLVNTTDALGNQTSIAYNSAGQPISITDPLGNTTQLAYESGNLVSITDPLGRTVSRFFDYASRLVAFTDPLGRVTRFDYNPLNQITKITNPLSGMSSFGYDPNGNLQTITDANTHSTTYTYDSMDRVATRKDALQNAASYQYDAAGNLIQFTDRRGTVTTYNYDSLNRLSFVGYGTQAGPTYESTVTYHYDFGNRLTSIVDSVSGTITPVFDNLDRLTSLASSQGTVGYTYDNAGRRATMTVPGQSAANYVFDNANRLTQITQGSAVVQFGYDANNRRRSLTLPNGIVVTYGYDSASQLSGITYSFGSNSIGNLTYSYDSLGHRSTLAGSFAHTGLPLAVTATSYNANNQLATWGTANLFYDLNGNMTSDGTHSYTWNGRNRLSNIDSGNTASFVYDSLGRRVSKSVLGVTTSFLYDGPNPVQELIGGTNFANSLSGGMDEVFQRSDSSGVRGFLTDALGSSIALTDSGGTLQTQYTFDPFGNTGQSGAGTTNSFAYTGRELDATGLYFSRARYYNPQLGRFISEDPMGLLAGVNSYAYVLDNPLNFVDPLGLCPMPLWDRLKLGGIGLFHVVLGGSKIAAGAAATVATDGLAAPLLIYAVPSGVGNYVSGTFEVVGAIVGDDGFLNSVESASQTATAVTTITGLGTLIAGGDMDAAALNSQVEGLATGGLVGGLQGGMGALDIADTGENILIVSKKPKKPVKCPCP